MAMNIFMCSVQLSREQARAILDGARAQARKVGLPPLTLVVLDGGGHVVAARHYVFRWLREKHTPHWVWALPAALLGNAISNALRFLLALQRLRKGILCRWREACLFLMESNVS